MSEHDKSDELTNVYGKFNELNDTFDLKPSRSMKAVRFDSEGEEYQEEHFSNLRVEGTPQIGDSIAIKFRNKKFETRGKVTKVGSRTNSETFDMISAEGIFKYLLVGRNIHYWRYLDEEAGEMLWIEEGQDLEESEILFPVTLTPKQQVGIPEVEQAKQEEIEKWYSYECFSIRERQPDMKVIPLAWVVNENSDTKSSNVNSYKARLVVRGDLEHGSLRTDSPTAPREILRLTLAISTIYDFKFSTCDISSAFLQSSKPDRDIFLRPPVEWKGPRGVVWKAEKGIYGLKDAARCWFIRFRTFLGTLEVENLGDSESCFISRDPTGSIRGFIITHVDDILTAGTGEFLSWFEQKVKGEFVVSKVKHDDFKYTGLEIKSNGDEVTIDQNFKLIEIRQLDISEYFGMQRLCDKGINTLQKAIGQLSWLASQTRPDLAFGTLRLSIIQRESSYEDLKEANKLLMYAQNNPLQIRMRRPKGEVKGNLEIRVFTDASHAKLESGVKSSEGRFVFLVNVLTRDVYIINWRAAMISQVCNSAKAAETHAVRNASDELVYYTELLKQVLGQKIPLYIFTDSKSLKDSIYSTTLIKEKSLRICIANIKQWVKQGLVKAIRWVDTKSQIADVLTKTNASSDLIRQIFADGKFRKKIYLTFQGTEQEVNAETLYQLTFNFFSVTGGQADSYYYELMHEWE